MRKRKAMPRIVRFLSVLVCLSVLALGLFISTARSAHAATDGQYFPETGHSVSGTFLAYWKAHGGLPVFGFPITDAQSEIDTETGKVFLTQWFERRRFELHPEFAGTDHEVLCGLIGKDLCRDALAVDPNFLPNPPQPPSNYGKHRYFRETGHTVSDEFLDYWQKNGGLDQFGFPISEDHSEIDSETGDIFYMQWFERARFERHYTKDGYIVLLGLLGNQIKLGAKSNVAYLWSFGRDPHAVRYPVAVATDPQGHIFVLDGYG